MIKVIQGVIYLILIILASIIGCVIGAVFGLFIGPAQLMSWVSSEGTTKSSSDTI